MKAKKERGGIIIPKDKFVEFQKKWCSEENNGRDKKRVIKRR